ncbi:hypothetical protein [Azospirillum sp. TSO22-1]|uniref:hypothetical protein n=1 Tax=Azospirillum sp. TSO22-1 TaxID=716789 RepID=UPI000D60AFA9|nr:hypothetical protein [Azospirillum sp. TSO22-1]PWC52443.1 hypothetical protein TSO221_14165 [Azospirillum sp. TSO22-1]
MPNRSTTERITAVTKAQLQAAQAASRAVQTRQRAEALFQQAERLRRMSMPTVKESHLRR